MRRTLIFLYGVTVYALFLPLFLWMVDFLAGVFVPKSVNDGPAGPVGLAVLVDLTLIALFGLQHAVMARPAFKRAWTRIIPREAERSTFVLAASALMALLIWQWRPIDAVIWNVEQAPLRWLLWTIHYAGWAIAFLSTHLIDHFDLFGLRQSWLAFKGADYTQKPFVMRAFYKFVRHPLMVGFLIAFWATPTMTGGWLLFAAGMSAYILIGIRMEERDLIAQHGPAYQAYRNQVPALIPRLTPASPADIQPDPALTTAK